MTSTDDDFPLAESERSATWRLPAGVGVVGKFTATVVRGGGDVGEVAVVRGREEEEGGKLSGMTEGEGKVGEEEERGIISFRTGGEGEKERGSVLGRTEGGGDEEGRLLLLGTSSSGLGL